MRISTASKKINIYTLDTTRHDTARHRHDTRPHARMRTPTPLALTVTHHKADEKEGGEGSEETVEGVSGVDSDTVLDRELALEPLR